MKLYLAPLHGVTNRVFRKVYFDHFSGFDAAVAPFILAVNNDQLADKHFKDLLDGTDEKVPLIPQLLGNEATPFVRTARYLAGLGYREVNWNLGCPFPMVANKKRGSGLLPYPELIRKVLDAACAQNDIRVSVKMRLGRTDPAEIMKLMPMLNEYPLSKVIIHPRIGTQMYKGEVNLDGFERAAKACAHEVMYNGDIKDLGTFLKLRERFPQIQEWMIGRWALVNPFLAKDIVEGRPVTKGADRLRETAAFHADLYGAYAEVLYGPAHLLDKMKEIWTYLGQGFPGRGKAIEAIRRAKTTEEYKRATAEIFGN
jgi:tRNA-dihydrouridine synthase